jgi:hypothetical protein
LLYLFDAKRAFGVAKTPPFDILTGAAVSPLKRTKKKMPLHRDIFWVGKQWAVTGFGMQACDQKQKGKFDIEAARLWEDDLPESMLAQKWLNVEDFDKALAIARERYPQPRRKAAAVVPAPKRVSATKKDPLAPAPAPAPAPALAPAPVPENFVMHAEGCRAKFLRPWRVRVRWQG